MPCCSLVQSVLRSLCTRVQQPVRAWISHPAFAAAAPSRLGCGRDRCSRQNPTTQCPVALRGGGHVCVGHALAATTRTRPGAGGQVRTYRRCPLASGTRLGWCSRALAAAARPLVPPPHRCDMDANLSIVTCSAHLTGQNVSAVVSTCVPLDHPLAWDPRLQGHCCACCTPRYNPAINSVHRAPEGQSGSV